MVEAKKLMELIKERGPAVILTGAGVSVPSGIPDFRGPSGLWKKVDPKVFDINYFLSNPLKAWKYFIDFFMVISKAEPNITHIVLAQLEAKGMVEAVITQNIDGLHQKAGSRKVVELHGNAFYTKCLKCETRLPTNNVITQIKEENTVTHKGCGGLLKPDVVYFGEPLPSKALDEAFRLARKTSLFIVIGSSLAVHPAGFIPLLAKEHGALLVIINLGETTLDDIADWKIELDASHLFKDIEKLLSIN